MLARGRQHAGAGPRWHPQYPLHGDSEQAQGCQGQQHPRPRSSPGAMRSSVQAPQPEDTLESVIISASATRPESGMVARLAKSRRRRTFRSSCAGGRRLEQLAFRWHPPLGWRPCTQQVPSRPPRLEYVFLDRNPAKEDNNENSALTRRLLNYTSHTEAS